jgi:hypothetical protein
MLPLIYNWAAQRVQRSHAYPPGRSWGWRTAPRGPVTISIDYLTCKLYLTGPGTYGYPRETLPTDPHGTDPHSADPKTKTTPHGDTLSNLSRNVVQTPQGLSIDIGAIYLRLISLNAGKQTPIYQDKSLYLWLRHHHLHPRVGPTP